MPAILVKLFVAIAIGLFLVLKFDIKLTDLIADFSDWRFIAVAALLPVTVTAFLSANRWQVFLRQSGIDERLTTLWRISLISQFQGLVLPSSQGADAFRIFYIEKRNPHKRGIAGSTVIVERMMGLLVLCSFTLIALPFLPPSDDYLSLVAIVVIISAGAVVAQFILLSQTVHQLYNGVQYQSRIVRKVLGYVDKLHAGTINFPYKRALLPSIFLISGYQVSLISVVYLVFRAYGYDIPFMQHLALYPVISILTLIPITIAGFGIREGFFVYFYAMIGVPAHIAVGVSLVNYALMALVPAVLGAVVYMSSGFRENPRNESR
ncbi:flippase-like domain-containing protein [Pseudomonas sp. REP124]|uniref:lysylphosphatidylglycerol synthase transmembrane domain-containing protein n=1 Tax=Pseudomonas sp. REP124 TaxID=2875731 RepID=UPI001CC9E96A|nr:lysylphosphatidylglycerol synthase transmembrane domain-containing protein [Pseudomonas sp. REP124]MBZ9784462.1 flippase-like domain-containing protein [Pseudomonas sp. REP124]